MLGRRSTRGSCGSSKQYAVGSRRGCENRGVAATRIASGLAIQDGGVDSFAEAAGRAALGLGGASADLVAVFAGAPNLDHVEHGLDAVAERLGSRPLMGCGAQ